VLAWARIVLDSWHSMQQELSRIWNSRKKTVVFITHSVDEAVLLGDRIMVMTAQPGKVKAKILVITGADEFMDFLQQTLGDAVTVHHGHMPEIEITSPTTATGIWALEDWVTWPTAGIHGFGHYHETYAKTGGQWRIQSSTLTRLRLDVDGAVGS